jgi:polyhydroxyalkanoate synthesis regulator phasin
MEFNREQAGKCGESLAKAKLYVNDKVVAEGDMKTQIATVFVSDLTAVTRSARNTDRPGNLRRQDRLRRRYGGEEVLRSSPRALLPPTSREGHGCFYCQNRTNARPTQGEKK